MPKIKLHINTDLCIGCRSCVTQSEEAFEMTPEGKAVVKEDWKEIEVDSPELLERINNAKTMCPMQIIEVTQDSA